MCAGLISELFLLKEQAIMESAKKQTALIFTGRKMQKYINSFYLFLEPVPLAKKNQPANVNHWNYPRTICLYALSRQAAGGHYGEVDDPQGLRANYKRLAVK
jgi:hypothetical protein